MNYEKIYLDIMTRAKNRRLDGYTEKHHILPRCLGGSNKKENIAELTAREHFISHWLLVKMYEEKDVISYRKMLFAFYTMRAINEYQATHRKSTSRLFEHVKQKLYGPNGLARGESHPCFGKRHSDATKKKMRESRLKMFQENPEELERVRLLSINRTTEHQEKINDANRGQKRTTEQRKRISDAHKGVQLNEKNGKSKRCMVMGKVYPSVREAHRSTGTNLSALYDRINDLQNEDYYYL